MKAIAGKLVGSEKEKLLFFFFSFCFFISACQASSSIESFNFLTVVKMGKLKLEVFNKKGQCAIRINNTKKDKLLNIPYPCGFVRSSKSLVAQTYNYKEVGQVFIVAGPMVDEKTYKNYDSVKPKHMCSNQGQAIIVQSGNLILRQDKNVPLGFCHQLGFDEKDYYEFAYPID